MHLYFTFTFNFTLYTAYEVRVKTVYIHVSNLSNPHTDTRTPPAGHFSRPGRDIGLIYTVYGFIQITQVAHWATEVPSASPSPTV